MEMTLNFELRKQRRVPARPDEGSGSSAGQELLAQLRLDIVNNLFAPEAKLKFADLTKRYGLGIGTLREALSHLVSEGFVTLDSGRGFRVAPVSQADLIEITEHYVDFEKRALADAIRHGDDEWEAGIVACYHRLNIIHELPWEERMLRHGEWVERHREFHEALVAACEARWLLRLRSLMFYQSERYRFLSKMSRNKNGSRKAIEHRAIMEATLARDTEKATRLLERHIRETAETVLANYEKHSKAS